MFSNAGNQSVAHTWIPSGLFLMVKSLKSSIKLEVCFSCSTLGSDNSIAPAVNASSISSLWETNLLCGLQTSESFGSVEINRKQAVLQKQSRWIGRQFTSQICPGKIFTRICNCNRLKLTCIRLCLTWAHTIRSGVQHCNSFYTGW